ncbi:MAG: polysaccharide deacetylase family protein [Clostridiales bacterium]|jgi:polysaccharide deacetylase family sporulation protein PdaB|nr:polysaccharide deacetylase family protein [Clostridiales bacterium]
MFVTVNFKRIVKTALFFAALSAAGILLSNPVLAAAYAGYAPGKLPVYSVETEKPLISITFDAAWGADKTARIVEVLKQYDVPATFFLVGFWIEKYEAEAKMLADAGIEIGNHSENHPDMAKLPKEKIKDQLESVNSRIEAVTGERPRFFRPPFGSYNDKVIEAAAETGLTVVQWDVDSLDWKDKKASSVTERVLKKVRNGSIILFHNNGECVVGAISVLIPALKNKGFEFVKVGDLLYTENYFIDHTGRQRKNR